MDYRQLFVTRQIFEAADKVAACKIKVLPANGWKEWLAQQDELTRQQLISIDFKAKVGAHALLLDRDGNRKLALLIIDDRAEQFLQVGKLAIQLPRGRYELDEDGWQPEQLTNFALAWGLGGYRFDYFLSKKDDQNGVDSKMSSECGTQYPSLVLPTSIDQAKLDALLSGSYLVRDLINLPAEQLYPLALAAEAEKLAKEFSAELRIVTGQELVSEFPAVAMVGRGSVREPCLIDLKMSPARPAGCERLYKLTLVGKGVCFDAGGLDLKSSAGMLQMKKDMAGAAHALGVARVIMSLQLPIELRVIIPAVENLPSGSAMKVRDIIRTRSGMTVEVGNTDAEGRLILADALALAAEDKPDLIVDFATLTGAARVALGMEIAALFSNNDQLAEQMLSAMRCAQESAWRLPLHQPYLEYLRSSVADLNNITTDSGIMGGAITAALFLQQFVDKDLAWMHFDFNGCNIKSSAGRPKGGEAVCLRGMLAFLQELMAKRRVAAE